MLRRAAFVRWVLLVLACALPLQAWSAAAMRCGTHVPVAPLQLPPAVHAMAADGQPCPGAQPQLKKHGVHSCSACAACCLGLALIPALPIAAAPEAAPQPLPEVVVDVAHVARAAPERPPRRARV